MGTKRRVTRYDIGAESATRPDIVAPAPDEDDAWGQSGRGEVLPPRWSEATIPDLPLRISMAASPPERAPTQTAVPRSGTRHRAPPTPAPGPTLAELAAERGSWSPPAPSTHAEMRAVVAQPGRARGSTWVPMAVAVAGIAAALGAAIGNTEFARRLAVPASAPQAPPAVTLAPPRPAAREVAHEKAALVARPSPRTIPEVRYEDLPLLQSDPAQDRRALDAGARPRRRFKAPAR